MPASTLRLLVCVAGIYASFLSWGLIQERLSTTPYYAQDGNTPKYFRSVIFLNTVQSTFSAIAALLYIATRRAKGTGWGSAVGLGSPTSARISTNARKMLLRCAQCALMASFGSPFGYASLRYIDYPTQILGKSCKLVPVMLMNIILYRRRFALHKYIVVATVTLGISLFMLYAPVDPHKRSKGASSNSLFGVGLLLVNLIVDGAVNSTQDEVFVRYNIKGVQMMLFMNTFATLITAATLVVPVPSLPFLTSSASSHAQSELSTALVFIRSHPKVLQDILLFSAAGAIGQLFIFDTLENFGSLTLVTITVTRKLFTMLLSLVVFRHRLTLGQWVGVITVFLGIGIEAQVKRRESSEKRKSKQRGRWHSVALDGTANGGDFFQEKHRLKSI